ncbi:hypothetical protein [Metapseudomonas otitidis]|jgi:hypothetical protein|uniref:hypothetical protein n=1 Tax=Metapseudomonas otitidis TaxID=319939 RepID=UPI0024AE0200|nr:hypothetical protein [Pseudomonas otitidis]MDI6527711.1 hypothetical protein [Pseudomonas otitidis]
MQHAPTLHAHPACNEHRVYELRRAARDAGIRYIPTKPRLIKPAPNPTGPWGGSAA